MTADEVAALVAEIRRYHQPIDDGTECDWCYGGDENKWPCPPARAAAALEAQQKRIEALKRVVYVARLWCDEADCVPMAVEDALIVLDSLS